MSTLSERLFDIANEIEEMALELEDRGEDASHIRRLYISLGDHATVMERSGL